MKITITGHDSAHQFLKDGLPVVVWTDIDYPLPKVLQDHEPKLHLEAHDVDQKKHRFIPPDLSHVEKFLEFTEGMDELACICHAGVSRSSSTAYVIASRSVGPQEALKLLDPGWHWPNRLIVYMGACMLKMPNVWHDFVDWHKKHKGLDPTPCSGHVQGWQNWKFPENLSL